MHITVSIRHDEKRLRRTVRFMLRGQLRLLRAAGLLLTVLSLYDLAIAPSDPFSYLRLVIALALAFAAGPAMVDWVVRRQPSCIRETRQVTLDDRFISTSSELVETRHRWAAIHRVTDTPETWYVMFNRWQGGSVTRTVFPASLVSRSRQPASGHRT